MGFLGIFSNRADLVSLTSKNATGSGLKKVCRACLLKVSSWFSVPPDILLPGMNIDGLQRSSPNGLIRMPDMKKLPVGN
jgi:hypothetical protein